MKTSKIKGRRENFGIKDLMFIISMANLLVYVLSVFGNTNLSLAYITESLHDVTLVKIKEICEMIENNCVLRLSSFILFYLFFPPIFLPYTGFPITFSLILSNRSTNINTCATTS